MEVGTFLFSSFFPFSLSLFSSFTPTSFFNLSPGFRATFSIARTWREITLGIMRSAIFPRIHERWKSSRNKERGTFANGDCTQCAHVGAAILQLVTYVPLVTGGRSRSRSPSLSPPSLQPQLSRQPLHSYGRRWLFSSGEAFHSRNSSASTTKTRTTENTA